jgi:hypothetical protein
MSHRPFSPGSLLPAFAAFAALVLPSACSYSTRGGDASVAVITGDATYNSTEDFDVKIEQMAYPLTFPAADGGKVDVSFDVTIKNLTKEPVKVRTITLQSMSGSAYQLETRRRQYDKTIAAGATEKLQFWAPALVTTTTLDTRAPLVVRAMLDLNVNDETRHETFNREVNGSIAAGVRVGGTR